jgi:peptidoglycan DL-endopeptidase CwlO
MTATVATADVQHARRQRRRHSPIRIRMLRWARTQRGKPYVWGATGPNGYDCSGLVYAAYHHATGRWGPRDTNDMLAAGWWMRRVRRPRRGDLAFYGSGHVELFVRRGLTFGAKEPGTDLGYHHTSAVWHPTMYFVVRHR